MGLVYTDSHKNLLRTGYVGRSMEPGVPGWDYQEISRHSPRAAARNRLALVVRTAGEDWGEVEVATEFEVEQLPPFSRRLVAVACEGAKTDWPPKCSGETGFVRRLAGELATDVAAAPPGEAAAAGVAVVGVAALSTMSGALLAFARGGMGEAWLCFVCWLVLLLLLPMQWRWLLLLLLQLLLRLKVQLILHLAADAMFAFPRLLLLLLLLVADVLGVCVFF